MKPDNNKQSEHDAAEADYNRKFNKTANQLDGLENDSADNNNGDTKNIKQQETSPTTVKRTTTTESKKGSSLGRKLGNLRHKSAFGFVGILLLMGVAYSSIFAPNIILVNMKEMFTNDLADATVALYTYNKTMLDHKIGKADCGDKESIKCKISTMSRQQVKIFERHGFKVNGEKLEEDNLDDTNNNNNKPESRYKVTSIVFPGNGGTATSGASFETNANKSTAMRSLVNGVFNPKSSFFMDERYKTRIKDKFDLTKTTTVYGTNEKSVNNTFNSSLVGKEEKFDEAGRAGIGLFTLKTDAAKNQLKSVATSLGDMAHSYTQLQCAYYTYGKVVSNSAKTAKEQTVARFAMQYLKAADQIKNGRSDEITANTLSGKLAWSNEGAYNGRNATDASMYKTIVFNEPVKNSENGNTYYLPAFDSIEGLWPAWMQVILTAKAVQGVVGAPGGLTQPPADIGGAAREYCLSGQTTQNKANVKPGSCPAATVASAPPPMAGAVSGVAAASDRICPMPPKGIWQMLPPTVMTNKIVTPYIGNIFADAIAKWADEKSKDFSADVKGIGASDALFAGTGAILGDMAMSRGMQPGNKESMKTYLAQADDINKEYEDIARYEAKNNPFDLSNKYSFMGSLAHMLPTVQTDGAPMLSALTNIMGLIPSSLSTIGTSANAFYHIQPLQFDEGRLTCKDAEYTAIGIEADVACNVRYSMGDTELKAKPDAVLKYMLEAHPDITKDGLQELQQRQGRTDAEGDAADVARQVSEAQQGSNAKFIDEKTGKPGKFSEYEKYLDYCVNREDPWGRSAMVVRRERLSEQEQADRQLTIDKNGIARTSDYKGSPYEQTFKASYMAVTEGTSMDQKWYTGEKCLENSEMLQNFRAWTMMCSVDGSYSGAVDCTEKDMANEYTDSFYTGNDILYTSWW